ncbi:MAG: DUF5696 domain-containing protein [Candidatus Brocadiia bacterium]
MRLRPTMLILLIALGEAMAAEGTPLRLTSRWIVVEVDSRTGRWSLLDRGSGVRWPTAGVASAGSGRALRGGFAEARQDSATSLRLVKRNGAAVAFELVRGGRTLELAYACEGEVKALGEALTVTAAEGGYAIVPCREGLLVPADGGKSFRRAFGSSEYEGCHMFMLGFVKAGSALVVDWDDAYVVAALERVRPREGAQRLGATFALRRSARRLRLTPLGEGDWDTVAAGYRDIAEEKGLAVTLEAKIRRNPACRRLVGASNAKLWTCLARRMNEQSTAEEWVKVRWTFDEAARIAEHLHNDLEVDRCLFMLGGWTEGGYDCRHPDNLPANPECGGNQALAEAIRRIQALGYVACLHDNYQDMYRDAKSFDLAFIEKDAEGRPVRGGRWLGGRAWMVCAPKQLELAQRPQNLPAIHKLFDPQAYFIDTTYAVGPRECHARRHPIGRTDDVAWKIQLSDYARDLFGLFGSECGREWALPHSDFFEGLVGVAGRHYHGLDPAALGALPIPFWEMVYHDCQVAWGKYGYAAEGAADFVAHHVLCARPLYYHSFPDHLYWREGPGQGVAARPRVVGVEPAGERAFRIRYAWDVESGGEADWRVFVHFGTEKDIKFQDDHAPQPPTSAWKAGQRVAIGPRTVRVPPSVRAEGVNVYVGLYDPQEIGRRARLPGSDGQGRVLAGRLRLRPAIRFEAAPAQPGPDAAAAFVRADGGWAEGLHRLDAFIKNTHEVLGPLHAATAHQRLARLELSGPDRQMRRATYGHGEEATTVVVNLSGEETTTQMALGGEVALPPWGFAVEGPGFAAFYATRWGGVDYPGGALFTLRALDGERLASSRRVRAFHGFGPGRLAWEGRVREVAREAVLAR